MRQTFAKRKILALFFSLVLGGCSSVFDSLYVNQPSKQEAKFLVGVLLPLSGKYEKLGNTMLDAINIGYYNSKNPYIALKIYDTQGNPVIARKVAKQALSDGVKIIIGPVLASSTIAVSKATANSDVPILTFSNDVSALKSTDNTYSISYLPSIELEMMIDFAIKNRGSKNFAIIAPQNKYGEVAVATIRASLAERGLNAPYVVSYPANEIKLEKYLRNLVLKEDRDYYKKIDSSIKKGEQVYDENQVLITKAPLPDLKFDTLVIADYGNRLNIVSSHLPFVDVDYRKVIILGNSNWKNDKIFKDEILQGSFFPDYSIDKKEKLREQYLLYYNQDIGSFEYSAYDSITLVSSLAYMDLDSHVVDNFTKEAIVNFNSNLSKKFYSFHIREDGISSRKLDIFRIFRKTPVPMNFDVDYINAIKVANYQLLDIVPIVDFTPDMEEKLLEGVETKPTTNVNIEVKNKSNNNNNNNNATIEMQNLQNIPDDNFIEEGRVIEEDY